jgi:hypothetical protein
LFGIALHPLGRWKNNHFIVKKKLDRWSAPHPTRDCDLNIHFQRNNPREVFGYFGAVEKNLNIHFQLYNPKVFGHFWVVEKKT